MKLKIVYKDRPKIATPQCVAELAKDYRSSLQECFVVYYLDSGHKAIAREICTIGLLNSCQISPMEVFKRALKYNCKAIILSHNHPSDETILSDQDKAVTKKLQDAGEILGIRVLDHVVVSKTNHTSFEELGLI